ncbi:ribonuclease H-like domain-containing protein, partial [Tanacetum coccineum]
MITIEKVWGYNAVAPPPTGLFAPPTIDLSNSGLEEFKQPEFKGYKVKVKKSISENSSNEIKKTSGAPIIEEWVSDSDKDKSEVMKSHSLSRRPFNQQIALKNRILNNKVNTAKVNSVNTDKGKSVTIAFGEQGINTVKSSACWADSSSSKGGKITGKGKIRTGKLDFEDVYFVKELKFNLFSVSQMCDRKNSVLFTETECLILSPDFKLPDKNQVMLKIPRKYNMYSFNLKNVVPSKGLTCLFAKAINDESKLWHRRLGHINFKTMNKLVKGNLVRGLPLRIFENDHTCVACHKGKQYKAT